MSFTEDAAAATAAAADRAAEDREQQPAWIPVKSAELSALLRSLSAQADVIAEQGRKLDRIAEHLGVEE
ncbi:hypothetical protein ACWD2L_00580 [Streptomyces sp. NPDC002754]